MKIQFKSNIFLRVSFGGEKRVQMIVYDDGITDDYSINNHSNKHNSRHGTAFTDKKLNDSSGSWKAYSIEKATRDYHSTDPWTCEMTFSKKGGNVDIGPPDLPKSTTTTTTTTKATKSGGGRLIVKAYLVVALQMIFGFVPAIFVGLSGRTA
uniref:Neur_chan_LBD domain-containing protein n=1 Tax=Globodera pallida TaxID=36090 RepID=A0A183BUY1_GLOPA